MDSDLDPARYSCDLHHPNIALRIKLSAKGSWNLDLVEVSWSVKTPTWKFSSSFLKPNETIQNPVKTF